MQILTPRYGPWRRISLVTVGLYRNAEGPPWNMEKCLPLAWSQRKPIVKVVVVELHYPTMYYQRFEKETVSRDSCLIFLIKKPHTWSPDQALKPSQIWLQIHRDTVR
jgi:hypothetical protein